MRRYTGTVRHKCSITGMIGLLMICLTFPSCAGTSDLYTDKAAGLSGIAGAPAAFGEMIASGFTGLLDRGIHFISNIVPLPEWLMENGNTDAETGKDPEGSSDRMKNKSDIKNQNSPEEVITYKSKRDYLKAYREAFKDAEKRHQQETADKLGHVPDDYEALSVPYNGIAYTLCDITGDGIRELIVSQMLAKHSEAVWVYSLKDGVSFFMGETAGDSVDFIEAGYEQGFLYTHGYKGSYGLNYKEWTGSEFTDTALFEGGWDYWETGKGPEEPLGFEELTDYYDGSRITDYPDPWCGISDFTFYTEESDAEFYDGEGITALYRPVLDMYVSGIHDNWTSLDEKGADDLLDPDSVSYMWPRLIDDRNSGRAGYLLRDLNHDGIPELLMTTSRSASGGTILDLYTISSRQVIHLASDGGTHYSFYLGKDDLVMNHAAAGATVQSFTGYRIVDGQLSEDLKLTRLYEEYSYKPSVNEEEVSISGQQYDKMSDDLRRGEAYVVVPLAEYEAALLNEGSALQEEAKIPADEEELYKPVLDMYYTCIQNRWEGCEDESVDVPVSFMWWHYYSDIGLEKAGYAFIDLDQNGIPELLTSPVDDSAQGFFQDLYTYRNGEIIHLASGGDRYFYSVTPEGKIYEDAAGGAMDHSDSLYHISDGMDEMQLEKVVLYDAYKDSNAPYFSGPDMDSLKHISEAEAASIQEDMRRRRPIQYKPFAQYRK